MIYAIGILKKVIDSHYAAIFKLKNIESEMTCDDIFAEEEILEREGYIENLQKAILKLTNND